MKTFQQRRVKVEVNKAGEVNIEVLPGLIPDQDFGLGMDIHVIVAKSEKKYDIENFMLFSLRNAGYTFLKRGRSPWFEVDLETLRRQVPRLQGVDWLNGTTPVSFGGHFEDTEITLHAILKPRHLALLPIEERATQYEHQNLIDESELGTKGSILFLAADPTDASRLRLGEELREIQEKLRLSKFRERFRLEQRMSVRPADISQALLDVLPQIVHFSGHGTATGALCIENQVGETHPIRPDALAALFEQFANQVKCVILNACYSETQAKAIVEHIDYVIGMSHAIGDRAAIAFAIGFYQALGAGRSIETAHRLGCVQIQLQNTPEHLTPILISKEQIHS